VFRKGGDRLTWTYRRDFESASASLKYILYTHARCIGVLRGTLISVTQLADRAPLANRLTMIKVWIYTSRACTVVEIV
jgi:hypothetical protein